MDVEVEGCDIGFDVVAVMTSSFVRLRARRCDIGLRLRPDPTEGGACANTFSDLHLYICRVGVLLYDDGCPYPAPCTNLFTGGSIQGSTHAAILVAGAMISNNVFQLMHIENQDSAAGALSLDPVAVSETRTLATVASADVVLYSAELCLTDCSSLQRGVWFGAHADIEPGRSTRRGGLHAPGTAAGGGSRRMERIARSLTGDAQRWEGAFCWGRPGPDPACNAASRTGR